MTVNLTELYRQYLRQIKRLPVLYLRSASIALIDELVKPTTRQFFRLKAADDTRAIARTKDIALCNSKFKRVRKVWSAHSVI